MVINGITKGCCNKKSDLPQPYFICSIYIMKTYDISLYTASGHTVLFSTVV